MDSRLPLVLSCVLIGFAGCQSEPTPTDSSPTPTATPTATPAPAAIFDGRPQFPPPPVNGIQLLTPPVVVPAGEEHLYCYFHTYQGEDVGVHAASIYQSRGGHHNLVFVTRSDEYQDDELVTDCDLAQQPTVLAASHLLIFPEPVTADVQNSVLPEGMALKFGKYTRVMLQYHYINIGDQPELTQDVVNLEFMDPLTVTTWAAPFTNSDVAINLPPNQVTTTSISCPFTGDFNVLYLAGHMHTTGEHIDISLTTQTGTSSLYYVDAWNSSYVELPPINSYEPGTFRIHSGDVMTTTCTWGNFGDQTIQFPNEMCVAYGLVYPSDRTIECTKGS